METTESTTRDRTTGKHENKEADQQVLLSSKPLHRFVQRGPRNFGIVIGIFGCSELMMGFLLAGENMTTSNGIATPFWQGVLFGICGILSIYTELHPSKKMVTVCLAMYVVSLLGIVLSFVVRVCCFYEYARYMINKRDDEALIDRVGLLSGIEGLLFVSSLFVFGILTFLSCIARLALKSTNTQIIVQHIPAPAPPPPTDTAST
ncbi:uncharacterized protein LOC114442173 [Parambassis ranga]|uniref:Uncharacterized protein LOC114442173 n=1 Tax=Parambassis ranga TaxID=210632 RepID=A0A6P7J485_9TELE|nr:uncharacterized protein LOC114442173 [Parambassis ranga]